MDIAKNELGAWLINGALVEAVADAANQGELFEKGHDHTVVLRGHFGVCVDPAAFVKVARVGSEVLCIVKVNALGVVSAMPVGHHGRMDTGAEQGQKEQQAVGACGPATKSAVLGGEQHVKPVNNSAPPCGESTRC